MIAAASAERPTHGCSITMPPSPPPRSVAFGRTDPFARMTIRSYNRLLARRPRGRPTAGDSSDRRQPGRLATGASMAGLLGRFEAGAFPPASRAHHRCLRSIVEAPQGRAGEQAGFPGTRPDSAVALPEHGPSRHRSVATPAQSFSPGPTCRPKVVTRNVSGAGDETLDGRASRRHLVGRREFVPETRIPSLCVRSLREPGCSGACNREHALRRLKALVPSRRFRTRVAAPSRVEVGAAWRDRDEFRRDLSRRC